MYKPPDISGIRLFSLTLLRVLIGWHFLYEGLSKLFNPAWTSFFYLQETVGPFSDLFKLLTSNASVLAIIDFINIWGLILIGISLFLGIFTRYFILFGIVLLGFYYLSYPPFAGIDIQAPMEGNYWIVNKTLIEASALFVLYLFPSSDKTGIDRFLVKKNEKKGKK